jgi:ATP-dependent Clp protease adaptor protein ClpS
MTERRTAERDDSLFENSADEGVAVAEPVVRPQREQATKKKEKEAADSKKQPKRQPRYNVVLWNDDDHSYDYVIQMMRELFGYPDVKGELIAEEVDKQGKAICLTTTMEHAELKRDQIHAYGKDRYIARCQGSMAASIEAVPGD